MSRLQHILGVRWSGRACISGRGNTSIAQCVWARNMGIAQWTLHFTVSHEPPIKCLPELVSFEGLGNIHFQAHSHCCWWDSVLFRLLSKSLFQFLATWASPQDSLQHSSCIPSKQVIKESQRESAREMSRSFGNLILKVTPFLPYSINQKKSLSPALTQKGEDYTRA